MITDLIKIIEAFCLKERHGTITIHVRNHEIQGVKTRISKYTKLPSGS